MVKRTKKELTEARKLACYELDQLTVAVSSTNLNKIKPQILKKYRLRKLSCDDLVRGFS